MTKFAFPVNALRSGEFYESDLFVDKEFLLRQGHRVTPALLIKLKRLGVKELKTRLESFASRMRERIEILPDEIRRELAIRRDDLLQEYGTRTILDTKLYKEAVEISARSFKEVGDQKLDDMGDLWQISERIAESVLFTGAEVLKPLDVSEPEVYYSHHSVNVAIMMTSILSDISDSVGRIQVAMGCLMHDLGKAFIPKEILFKRGPLTVNEFDVIKTHIDYSTKLLSNCGEITESIKGMVSAHHEKYNGTGYPGGLTGENIPYLGRWLSVCDVYDALTTSRAYQQRIAPPIALELIVQCAGSQFDPDCARGLVERMGSYPVGSYLLLKDNRIGLVLNSNKNDSIKDMKVGIIDISTGEPIARDLAGLDCKLDVIDTFDI